MLFGQDHFFYVQYHSTAHIPKSTCQGTTSSNPVTVALCSILFSLLVLFFSFAIALSALTYIPRPINMSVRVVARIRPLLNDELERDVIVRAETKDGAKKASIVKIPNPKNESEEFSFTFNSVYDQAIMQEEIFNAEGAPLSSHCVSLILPR